MALIDRETLENMYTKREMPIHEIAENLEVSVGSVFNYLKMYGIPTRKAMTERTKWRLSAVRKGKSSPKKGCHLSEETKRKISESHKGIVTRPSLYGGHKKKRDDGYIKVYVPNHPYASKDGYVMEHILAMEKQIGRYITRDEVVHHINHVRDDNRIENLRLMTFKEHASLHMKERWEKKKGVRTYQ